MTTSLIPGALSRRACRRAPAMVLTLVLAACGGGGDDMASPADAAAQADDAAASLDAAQSVSAAGLPDTPDANAAFTVVSAAAVSEAAAAPAPTPRGTPDGVVASARIGPAGGTLSSADGAATLVVPPGALAQPTLLSLQRVTITAHGAKGPSYRLKPAGLVPARPLTLRFKVDDAMLAGTALGAMTLATQDAAGRWHARRQPVRDAAGRTLAVPVQRMGDWAAVAGAQLLPNSAQVPAGDSVRLSLYTCAARPDEADTAALIVDACKEPKVASGQLQAWAVNGVNGGNPGIGMVVPVPATPDAAGGRALYQAPVAPPARNPVAVSVDYRDSASAKSPLRLVSKLTVVKPAGCAWLRRAATLRYEIAMSYEFSGVGPLGSLRLSQQGTLIGEMRSIDQNDLFGTWRGLTTRGSARVRDQHSLGNRTDTLTGSGLPANGTDIDQNQLSGATLLVDYRTCSYALNASVSVLSSYGQPNEKPRVRAIAGFTRGGVGVYLANRLKSVEDMPPRREPSPGGTYFPGGLGIGLVGDGYADEKSAGWALVQWDITPVAP